MRTVFFDAGFRYDDPNIYWGDPAYQLEPGDVGYVAPVSPTTPNPTKKTRKYMATNPTPDPLSELLAAGEDLCDGLEQHADTIGVKQNTFVLARADLDALIGTTQALNAAEGAEPAAYAALRTADSNGKGFIARTVKILSISLGNSWSDAWNATGLPDNTVGIPSTQDKRFAALKSLEGYFKTNPSQENALLNVTAAIASTLYNAISLARKGVNNALNLTKTALLERDKDLRTFRLRYRSTITELEQLLDDEDPKWYDFGLNRPADPAQPGQPSNVHVTALGTGHVLVQIDGARRANSFNFFKKVVGTDVEPVKLLNTQGTQQTFTGLPVGATVEFTVTGVNDAGEGQASEAVSVVVG